MTIHFEHLFGQTRCIRFNCPIDAPILNLRRRPAALPDGKAMPLGDLYLCEGVPVKRTLGGVGKFK